MQQQIENYLNFLEAGMEQEPNTPPIHLQQ